MSTPVASVEITASSRSLGAKLREARTRFGQFADGVRSELNKVALGGGVDKGDFGKKFAASFLGNMASAGASKALGFMEEMGRGAFDFQDKLKRLQITAEATPADMQKLADTIRSASDATGLSKSSILEASNAYVALTGDMETAQSSTMTWARVAQATNTSIADISSTAAAMTQQLHITPAQMEEAFSALAIQGKKGAVELKDLAGLLGQIAPQWAMFSKGTGVTGLREMGAALQIVKRGFGGDAAETVTGLQSMLTALVKNASKFEGQGIKIFDKKAGGKKEMRDVLDIVESISKSPLVNDPTKMEKAFGRVEAYRAFLQLSQNRDALKDLVTSSQDATVIQKDLDTYLSSTGGKVGMTWEQAKNRIYEAFTPERIEAFANIAVKLAGALATIAEKVSGILDGAKSAGEEVAKLVGGESEEDRIKGIRVKRTMERGIEAARAYQKQHPGATMGEAVSAARSRIASENALRDSIYDANARGGVDPETQAQRTAQDAFVKLMPGFAALGGVKAAATGGYTVAEATALTSRAKGSTDEAMTMQAIAASIRKAIEGNLNITIQIGNDAVAKAAAAASKHRTDVKK